MREQLPPKTIVLIILDGWGVAPPGPGNAITLANLPNFNKYWAVYPHTQLLASGESVGLPHGIAGNSEVGHLNIGAGRVVYQELPRISMAIADGDFIRNPAFLAAASHVISNKSAMHLMGLIGPGMVHSSMEHLFALLWLCKEQNIQNVFLHLFTDGRDAPPYSSTGYITQIENKLKQLGIGKIATISGRYFGMDRDNRWDRTKSAYDAIVFGEGLTAHSANEAVEQAYKQNRSDEFILPTVIVGDDNKPLGKVSAHDGVIFFNFRPDRSRQLTKAFVLPNFENIKITQEQFDPYIDKYKIREKPEPGTITTFQRGPQIPDLFFVTMIEYEKGLPAAVAFPYEQVGQPITRLLSERGFRQLHLAETEKYAHVTYFFNGRREDPFPMEDRIVIPSPKVATYDLKPEMSAYEITDFLITRIKQSIYDFIVVNFANPDMVGHTGVLDAAVKACEVVDDCLGRIVKVVNLLGGACIITSDHGNVEEMKDPMTGDVDTEHNANPVPFIVIRDSEVLDTRRSLPMGILADVSPTILGLLKVNKPAEMTGKNLLA